MIFKIEGSEFTLEELLHHISKGQSEHFKKPIIDELSAAERERNSLLERLRVASEHVCQYFVRADNAERERDELKQRLANAEHQLHMAELAKFNLRNQRKAQFRKRREAEAEIARRDAAAGEPVAWQYRYNDGKVGDWKTADSESECNHSPCYERRPIYTAAPPAVLPPEMGCVQDGQDLLGQAYIVGYNRCRADALSLGAQQQKVVELPEPVKWPEIPFKYFSEEQVFSMLDAASVKWEVKK